jgi:hypothetical protein
MRRPFAPAAAALLAVIPLALPSEAASTLVFKAVAAETSAKQGPYGRVYAGSQGVMTLGGYGWKSVAAAEEVARRLNVLAEEGLRPDEIKVRRVARTHLIEAPTTRIVQIDRVIAAVHASSPERLAQDWAANLRAQFGRPYLSCPSIVVPLGENRSASVRGNISGALSVRSETSVVTPTWDPSRKLVQVFGQQVGRTEIVLTDTNSLLRVPVQSAKYAARLARSLVGGVSGNPATSEEIIRAVKAAVAAALELEPGAWANVKPWIKGDTCLTPDQSTSVPVRISAAGEEYLSYRTRVEVPVRNEQLPPRPVEMLMVSNSPERLLSLGLWYEGELNHARSARLFYHHLNATDARAELVVELWNLGEDAAEVHVIAGSGGPSRDESWAGHRAATVFLGKRAANRGWIVPLRAGTATPVFSQSITPAAVASGAIELRLSAPADLRVRLYLASPRLTRMPYPITSYSPSPFLGRWQYRQAHREVAARYVVGGDWAFVTIGDQPLAGQMAGDRLLGNYGLSYDINIALSNPTEEDARVVLLLEPAGGPARGSLLIDGTPVGASLIAKDSEAELARYGLAPGETREVCIQTMPEGGSHYPVRLVARSL